MGELLHLAFHQPRDRNPGPSRDHLRDIVFVYFFLDQTVTAARFLEEMFLLGGQILFQ
jgi:hypothetical protein